jgi:hypothetical protein
MSFRDFNIEVDDNVNNEPEHFNGSVTTAGSPVTISLTSTRDISNILLINPSKGPNANGINDLLYLNVDGGSTYITLARGESVSLPVNKPTIKINSNVNGVKYELIAWG